jgi:hypothetical protein
MKIVINESQHKLILETVNRSEILSLVKKSNSFTKEYGMDITKNSFDDDLRKSIVTVEKFLDVSVERILNQFQIYVDSQSEVITDLLISSGDYSKLVVSLIQKFASILLSEYNKIGNVKKYVAKKMIKSDDISKNKLKEKIANNLDSYVGNIIEAMFRRLPNWIDDSTFIDKTTKMKYRQWCKNVETYIDKIGYPYWTKIADIPTKDLYS